MIASALRGECLDMRVGDHALDSPSRALEWGSERIIEAEFLRELVTGAAGVQPRAVVLRGVRIRGGLDLESMALMCPLVLQNCFSDGILNLRRARCQDVAIVASELQEAVVADGLDVDGSLDLSGSVLPILTAVGARITGNLHLDGARFRGARWPLRPGSDTLRTPAPSANSGEFAVIGEQMRVDGAVSCRALVVERGEVRLVGSKLGVVVLQGALLDNPAGPVLTLDRASVAGAVLCRSRFSAHGASSAGLVSLREADVHGGLTLTLAVIVNSSGPAVAADGMHVGGSMVCTQLVAEGQGSAGTMTLTGASIDGDVELGGAQIRNLTGPSLVGERLTVGGDLSCKPATGRSTAPFVATGCICLNAAHVHGAAHFDQSELEAGLSLSDAKVEGRLSLRFAARSTTTVDLQGAALGSLCDSKANRPSHLRLSGCTYRELIGDGSENVDDRLDWVGRAAAAEVSSVSGTAARAPTFSPQPFQELQRFYRRHGDETAARRVAIARERHRRASLNLAGRAWSSFLRWTVGYGYRTWQAAIWLAGVVLVGWIVFAVARHHDHMHALKASEPAPPFHAWLYALDVTLPVVDLGQDQYWVPTGIFLGWYVVSIMAGWVLVTAVVGALTAGLVRS